MDSGQECAQQAEEKYWLPEEQKEESNYQLRPHLVWPFCYDLLGTCPIMGAGRKERISLCYIPNL